jgi:acyl-lipid omega-6 desaturase (Delta-12 desaturase)
MGKILGSSGTPRLNSSLGLTAGSSDLTAIQLLLLPLAFGIGWIYLGPILGTLSGAIFLAQCFILIHEFGHRSFFKSKPLNDFFGHIVSFFIFIPFTNWKTIHRLHHRWTGYRDKDPTTEKTFDDQLNDRKRKIINVSWRYSIPLFTLGYRFGIYWSVDKLRRHLSRNDQKRCLLNSVALLGMYVLVVWAFPGVMVRALPAVILSFVITDHVILSQHSNIEMKIAGGSVVSPMPAAEQAVYSRTILFPRAISRFFLFNMNYHEAHHAKPHVPCYELEKVSHVGKNAYAFLPWIRRVKTMSGVDFIFKTSNQRSDF